MSWQPQPRIVRYSRPPSLSTISSNEEAEFHNSRRTQASPPSPYTSGASDRNSIVSPLSAHDYLPSSTYTVSRPAEPERSLPPTHQDFSESYWIQPGSKTVNKPAEVHVMYNKRPRSDDSGSVYSNEVSMHSNIQEPPPFRPTGPTRENTDTSTSNLVNHPKRSISPSMSSEKMSMDDAKCEEGKFKQTRWMWMLLQLDEIPMWQNVFVALCTWVILAAYLVLPGTFTKLKSSETSTSAPSQAQSQLDNITQSITAGIDHLGLAVVSALLASGGAFGCIMMWIVHWRNHLWLGMKIFMPVMLNSYAGLLTTVVNVYTAQKGVWSITAKLNAIVSGSVAGLATLIYCLYTFVLLKRVKEEHKKLYPEESGFVNPMRLARMRRYMAQRKLFAKSAK